MHKKSLMGACALALASAVFGIGSVATAAQIGAGNLVVIRVGDGTTTAVGTALPVILDEYQVTYTGTAPTGVTRVQSIAAPTGAAGTAPASGQRYLAQGGTAGGEGGLTLSTNGQYMMLAGYNSGIGDVTNPGAAGTEDRVVGRLDLATGTLDTSTVLVGLNGNTAVRNAFSTDGSDIWVSSSNLGVRYTTFGNTAGNGTGLTGTGNERRVQVNGGQLYTSRQSAPVDGPATVGTGTPTSGAQTVTLLPGFPTANAGASTYDYFFADADTIYVSDDRNSGTGGLQKWIFDGTNWNMAYSLLVVPGASNSGIKSLNGFVDASGNVVLFGSTTGAQGVLSYLYGFADTLTNTDVSNVTANKLLSAATDFDGGSLWSLRGVAVAPGAVLPEPGSIALIGIGGLGVVIRRRQA
jgi:hypothetical protein